MKNLKKIILFTAYGSNVCTPEMKKILDKTSFPENRFGEIISYVENKAILIDGNFDKIKEYLQKDKNNIVKLDENGVTEYVFWSDDCHWTSVFSIIEVDINRPWTIKDYDGAESIYYLDDYKCMNKNLNYYRKY